MDELGATIAAILLFLFVFTLFFVFAGDPDIWDLAHENIMKRLSP